MPLNTYKDNNNNPTYNVADKNTGYIIGGGYETNQKSDIRVSEYYIYQINQNGNYLNVNGSGDSQTFTSFKDDSILTIDATGKHAIIDSNNSFVKYSASKKLLTETLSNNGQNNNSNLYGLHFMDASISIDHLITAPKVMINGTEYTNYEMPEDCIDFQLASKGYINFFAGTYYTNNDSFFSLHEIKRDSNNKIIAINHISKIYQNKNNKAEDFIYEYVNIDPTTGFKYSNKSNTAPSSTNYDVLFDRSWIEKQSSSSAIHYSNGYGRTYYFEIPVNSGEYAMGVVDGKSGGGYLMYLDIGASGSEDQHDYNTDNMIANDPIFTQMEYVSSGFVINSCFNIAYVVPVGATKETFWIKISRTGTVFAVEIGNTTSNDFYIDILLVDDDDEPDNEYPYTYTLKYNSGAVSAEYNHSASFKGTGGGTTLGYRT